jgi:thiol-disulfide isomerase/thioredoxin
VGQLSPAFDLPVLNIPDSDHLSSNDLLGKPLLLSFWTTWCPYCRAQTPVLVEAYTRYGSAVEFIGINVEEGQEAVQSYLQEQTIAYPILLDLDRQVADLYNVTGFPTTYFIDPAGVVVSRQIGQLKPNQVEKYIEQLLAISYP